MDLQGLLNSRRAGIVALRTSRLLPPRLGYSLADQIADRIAASPQTPMVKGIRLNQWIVSGQQLLGDALDRAVLETLQHIARSFYTLFHYIDNLEGFSKRIEYDARAESIIRKSQETRQGMVVVGLHMSNFDLIMQSATKLGLRALALSLPQADEAVDWQHQLRRRSGVEILPATIQNFRLAIERLKAGEIVITGMDRPLADTKYRPRFFGHPANVPVHYIQLALKAQVPLVVMGAVEQDDGIYRVNSSDIIHLQHLPDRRTEILQNAEMVLSIAENFIRLAPQQWAVFLPVWPDLLEQVP